MSSSLFIFGMSKDTFIDILKKSGYAARLDEKGVVTVEVVGEAVKQTFINVKLLANKVGYKHSIRVKRLEETNGKEA